MAIEKKDVVLKGVKVVYVDSPSRLERVFKQRQAEGSIDNMGNMFVHLTIEKDGQQYNGLSQTLRILGQEDYEKLLKAYQDKSEIDITVRMDEYSAKSGNYFFFVGGDDVSVADLFKTPFEKPRVERKSVVDLLGD